MNKICTDVKQSKRLIELGIDVKTADMHYMYRHWEIDENTVGAQSDASIGFDSDFYYGVDNGETYIYIPAWSLSALLEIISRSAHNMDEDGNVFLSSYKNVEWSVAMNNTDCEDTFINKDPVDAAFEMVVYLLKQNKI